MSITIKDLATLPGVEVGLARPAVTAPNGVTLTPAVYSVKRDEHFDLDVAEDDAATIAALWLRVQVPEGTPPESLDAEMLKLLDVATSDEKTRRIDPDVEAALREQFKAAEPTPVA